MIGGIKIFYSILFYSILFSERVWCAFEARQCTLQARSELKFYEMLLQ